MHTNVHEFLLARLSACVIHLQTCCFIFWTIWSCQYVRILNSSAVSSCVIDAVIKCSGLIDEWPLLCFHWRLQWCEPIISAETGEKHRNHHRRMRGVSKMWSEESSEFDRTKELRLCLFPFQTPTRRRNDQPTERQSTSSDSQKTVWSQPHWCHTGRCHWARTTSYSQDAHITPLPISHFSLFATNLLIPEVCRYCICMYKIPTIGLEHISHKRWAIPHCVLESCFILPASCDLKPLIRCRCVHSHCESMSEHTRHMLTVEAGRCVTSLLTTSQPQTCRCPASAHLLRSPTPAGSPWATSNRSGQPITSIQGATDKANTSRRITSVSLCWKQESLGGLLVLIPFSVPVHAGKSLWNLRKRN